MNESEIFDFLASMLSIRINTYPQCCDNGQEIKVDLLLGGNVISTATTVIQ